MQCIPSFSLLFCPCFFSSSDKINIYIEIIIVIVAYDSFETKAFGMNVQRRECAATWVCERYARDAWTRFMHIFRFVAFPHTFCLAFSPTLSQHIQRHFLSLCPSSHRSFLFNWRFAFHLQYARPMLACAIARYASKPLHLSTIFYYIVKFLCIRFTVQRLCVYFFYIFFIKTDLVCGILGVFSSWFFLCLSHCCFFPWFARLMYIVHILLVLSAHISLCCALMSAVRDVTTCYSLKIDREGEKRKQHTHYTHSNWMYTLHYKT